MKRFLGLLFVLFSPSFVYSQSNHSTISTGNGLIRVESNAIQGTNITNHTIKNFDGAKIQVQSQSGTNGNLMRWRNADGRIQSKIFHSMKDFMRHYNNEVERNKPKLSSTNDRLNALKARFKAGKLSKRELKLYQKVTLYETIENATRTAMLRNPVSRTKAKHREALKDLERALDKFD